MNEMLDRIETARTQQLQFVNDASHELNSPLTTLVGLLDLSRTKSQPIDPDTVDSIMMPEALRLQQMVADLLLLARADESGVPLRLGDVDLDEVVSSEVARIEALTDRVVEARIVAVRVHGDAEKLGRALRNIADNAARHTRDRLGFAMLPRRPRSNPATRRRVRPTPSARPGRGGSTPQPPPHTPHPQTRRPLAGVRDG